jgi:HEAT repeat protein
MRLTDGFPLLLCLLFASLSFASQETVAGSDRSRGAQITIAIANLQDRDDPKKRSDGAKELAELGARDERVITALAAALAREQDDTVSIEILKAAASFGKDAAPIVDLASRALASGNVDLREAALNSLTHIASELDTQSRLGGLAPTLIILLDDKSAEVRYEATFLLQKIGPSAHAAVPKLIEHTKDEDPGVRSASLATLGVLDPGTKAAAEAAIQAIADPVPSVRSAAAFFMNPLARDDFNGAAAALVRALRDQDEKVRRHAASELGNMPKESVILELPRLVEVARDATAPDAAKSAIGALGLMRANAHGALRDLIFIALNDTIEEEVSFHAAVSLARIGKPDEVVDVLVKASQSRRSGVRQGAGYGLGELGPLGGEKGFTALAALLDDNDPGVRGAAIKSIGKFGPLSKRAVPQLLRILEGRLGDGREDERREVAVALAAIANSIRDASDTSAVGMLRQMHDALQKRSMPMHHVPEVRQHAETVRRAAEYLELTWWFQVRKAVGSLFETFPKTTILVLAATLWILILTVLYRFWPIVILRANDALSVLDVQMPDWLGGAKIPLRGILLIKVYAGRPRVLDAWTSRHAAMARARFAAIDTVASRAVHVEMPVTLAGHTVTKMSPVLLRPAFESDVSVLLISGEGGVGKTSLACDLGKAAMAAAPEQRVARHLMLPIWLEDELPAAVDNDSNPLFEVIRHKLKYLIDAMQLPSAELVETLLARKRLLVIVDRFSELSEKSRDMVERPQARFSINNLIVTSRTDEKLGGAPVTRIAPLRVEGNRLSSFLEAYLTEMGKRSLLTDEEFFDSCGKLSRIVGQRTITVLLAKLFADQVIKLKEQTEGIEPLEDVPALFVRYINSLNQTVVDGQADFRTVQKDCRAAAWRCVRDHLVPTDTRRDDVLQSLAGPDSETRLSYLEKRLSVIKSVEPDYTAVRFVLDPLAEYLAALHLAQGGEDVQRDWLDLLERIESNGALSKGRGFLLAVNDCVSSRGAVVPAGLATRVAAALESRGDLRR